MLPRRLRRLGLAAVCLTLALAGLGAAQAPTSEAARWLRGYLRIDTSNPPGGERAAAAYLARILHREGVATQIFVTGEGRANLYARLPGERRGEDLLLLHHIDVVPAGEGWTVAPFAGELRDQRLWGRGALDAKSLGVAQLAAFIELARSGRRLERGVALLATADEESGGGLGVAWLLEEHPELFEGVGAVLNEGGFNHVRDGEVEWWGLEVAQKRPLWLEVTARGRGGHGAGFNPESANHRLLAGLAEVLAMPPRWRVTPAVRQYLATIAPLYDDRWRPIYADIDRHVAPEGPKTGLLPGMSNLFLDTVQVTVLDGGDRINVVPESARARLDVRLLPDTDEEAFLAKLRQAMGDGLEIEVLLSSPLAPASPADSRLYRVVEEVLERPVVPVFISGFTDSRYFRERGIPAYGFSPFVLAAADLGGIHGPDERIPLPAFDRGVERLTRIVAAYAGAAPGRG